MFESADDKLLQQALRYARGEMNPRQAAAFEESLAASQHAREALVAATAELQARSAGGHHKPDLSYRRRVRDRLHARSISSRVIRPALWALAGVAATLVALALVRPWFRSDAPPRAPDAGEPAAAVVAPASDGDSVEVLFSDLSNAERVTRVRDEQAQRRQRSDDFRIQYPLHDNAIVPMTPRRPAM